MTRGGRHARQASAWRVSLAALAVLGVLGLGTAGLRTALPARLRAEVAGPATTPGATTATATPPTATPPTATPPTATPPAATLPATATPPAAGPPSAPPADAGVAAFEAQVVTLVNQERAANGCPALTPESHLASAARAHSADMAQRNYFDHTTPEGVDFAARISAAGYRWSLAAENIAAGQPDPVSVMRSWMDSDGHRANILNCRLRHIGVGLAYGSGHRPYWTQDFASPR